MTLNTYTTETPVELRTTQDITEHRKNVVELYKNEDRKNVRKNLAYTIFNLMREEQTGDGCDYEIPNNRHVKKLEGHA